MNAEYRQRRREYRERQPGRRIAGFTLLAAAAVAALSFLLFYSSTRASSLEAPEREHKYYTSVTVAFGQDMDALVDEYYSPAHYAGTESYLREVYSINYGSTGSYDALELRPGDHIILPYYSESPRF